MEFFSGKKETFVFHREKVDDFKNFKCTLKFNIMRSQSMRLLTEETIFGLTEKVLRRALAKLKKILKFKEGEYKKNGSLQRKVEKFEDTKRYCETMISLMEIKLHPSKMDRIFREMNERATASRQ